jgi:DNA-binding NtrC family response regulator
MDELRYKILIVDDEASFRNSLKGALKKEYDISEAGDSEGAVQQVTENPPDVVLLDISMPGVDGLETLQKIREIDDYIAVIMVTAYGEIKTVVQAINQGAVDYLTKPIDMDELQIAISKALERLRYKQEIAALRKALAKEYNIDNLIGRSPEFLEALSMAKRIAGQEDCQESGCQCLHRWRERGGQRTFCPGHPFQQPQSRQPICGGQLRSYQ